MNYNKKLSDERVIMRMYESHQISAKDAGGMLKGLIKDMRAEHVYGNSYQRG